MALNFGSFAREIREVSSFDSDVILVETLFAAFTTSAHYTLERTICSKYINSRRVLPGDVTTAARAANLDVLQNYFARHIIPKTNTVERNKLISKLVSVFATDSEVPNADKQAFMAIANEANLALFLVRVFLFAVFQNNNNPPSKQPLPSTDNAILLVGGKVFLNNVEVKMPDKLTPPSEFASEEAIYIAELLRAYSDAEGAQVDPSTMADRYKRNLNDQRQHYFNAEAVRRRVRDVYKSTDNDVFETFKQDVYEGVINVHDQDHANGYARLLAVLTQACNLQRGSSLLEQFPKWIGNSQRQGVCHILVNENRIKWVVGE